MMLRAVLFSVTVSLVAALPQNIDFAAVNAVPTPSVQGPPATLASQVPTFNPSVAASSAAAAATTDPVATDSSKKRSLAARNACSPQPAGAGPSTSPDQASAFLQNPTYNATADGAAVPQGYRKMFSDLMGSTSQNGYLGL